MADWWLLLATGRQASTRWVAAVGGGAVLPGQGLELSGWRVLQKLTGGGSSAWWQLAGEWHAIQPGQGLEL